MNESEIKERIRILKNEAKNAGYTHKRDLNKHIKRMKRELYRYNKYQTEARKA